MQFKITLKDFICKNSSIKTHIFKSVDDEDDSGWSTVDDSSTDASDTSDFDDSFSVPSEDSSVADGKFANKKL